MDIKAGRNMNLVLMLVGTIMVFKHMACIGFGLLCFGIGLQTVNAYCKKYIIGKNDFE